MANTKTRSSRLLKMVEEDYGALNGRIDRLAGYLDPSDYTAASDVLNEVETVICDSRCIKPDEKELEDALAKFYFINCVLDEYDAPKSRGEDRPYRWVVRYSGRLKNSINSFTGEVKDIRQRLAEGQSPEKIADDKSKSPLDRKSILKLIDKIRFVEAEL